MGVAIRIAIAAAGTRPMPAPSTSAVSTHQVESQRDRRHGQEAGVLVWGTPCVTRNVHSRFQTKLLVAATANATANASR